MKHANELQKREFHVLNVRWTTLMVNFSLLQQPTSCKNDRQWRKCITATNCKSMKSTFWMSAEPCPWRIFRQKACFNSQLVAKTLCNFWQLYGVDMPIHDKFVELHVVKNSDKSAALTCRENNNKFVALTYKIVAKRMTSSRRGHFRHRWHLPFRRGIGV